MSLERQRYNAACVESDRLFAIWERAVKAWRKDPHKEQAMLDAETPMLKASRLAREAKYAMYEAERIERQLAIESSRRVRMEGRQRCANSSTI